MILHKRLLGAALAVVLVAAPLSFSAGAQQAGRRRARPAARAGAAATPVIALTPDIRAALARVNADSLRGHLSFIASDALEGRNTPSRGLDVAAEYIAAQFRRAGLEPAGDDKTYFQTAMWGEVVAGSGRRPRNPLTEEQAAQKVRNVVGILRGSDPSLKNTYVILSAHYDHVGVREAAEGPDKIYNGANDDGSGTVAVMEIANALSQLKRGPKRSILFMAFFGEEKGLLGSQYYGRKPVVPIEQTVAQLNLEQIGRTDDSEGPQLGTAAVTGYDFSDVGETLRRAGALAGVRFYKHPTKSDAFFGRSDNQSLADQGVPAHTSGVAFEFPDYHKPGDEWQKIDYANMAKVTRGVMLGLLTLADSAREPRWNEANPKAAKYLKVWRERQGQ